MLKRIVLHVVMADGTEHNPLTVTNPALVAFDFERARLDWPGPADAPMLWQTFLAWAQLVAAGDYPRHVDGSTKQTTFQAFRERDCLHVEQLKGHEAENADPTTEAGSDSASASPQPQASASTGSTPPTTES